MRILFIITLLICFSCGKKGALERPEDYKRPNFDEIIAK